MKAGDPMEALARWLDAMAFRLWKSPAKGAQAVASLKILELKELMDSRSDNKT